MDFDKVQAEWVLGRFPWDQLPEVAAQAMMQGYEGPFILDLVGYAAPSLYRLKTEVVEGAFREMGLPPISKAQAMTCLARTWALKILRNQIPPWKGAKEITRLVDLDGQGVCERLQEFAYLFYEEEYWSDHPKEFDHRVIELAWALLEEDPSR